MARIQFFLNWVILFALTAWAIPSPVFHQQAGDDDRNPIDGKVVSTGHVRKGDVITHPRPKPFPNDFLAILPTGDDDKDKKAKKPSRLPKIVIGEKKKNTDEEKKTNAEKAKQWIKKLKGNNFNQLPNVIPAPKGHTERFAKPEHVGTTSDIIVKRQDAGPPPGGKNKPKPKPSGPIIETGDIIFPIPPPPIVKRQDVGPPPGGRNKPKPKPSGPIITTGDIIFPIPPPPIAKRQEAGTPLSSAAKRDISEPPKYINRPSRPRIGDRD